MRCDDNYKQILSNVLCTFLIQIYSTCHIKAETRLYICLELPNSLLFHHFPTSSSQSLIFVIPKIYCTYSTTGVGGYNLKSENSMLIPVGCKVPKQAMKCHSAILCAASLWQWKWTRTEKSLLGLGKWTKIVGNQEIQQQMQFNNSKRQV